MNFFQVSSFITAIISFILGLAVYTSNKKTNINKAWAIAAFFIGIWSFSLFEVVSAPNYTKALFWQYILDASGIFIPIAFFTFTLYLLKLDNEYKFQKYTSWLAGLVLLILSFTDFFKHGVTSKAGFHYWIDPGPVYYAFPVIFIFYVFFSLVLLINKYKKTSDGLLKMQIKYVLGALIFGFGAGVTNFFPQMLNSYPFGNYMVVLYVVFISYAILKHHLFNIKVIATELLVYGLWIFLLIRTLLEESSQARIIDGSLLAIMVVLGILLIKGVINEVRQRERLEKITVELEAANERLRQLDEAKSEFLSIASHQLRTPLTSIKGILSMLLEEFWGPLNDDQKKYLNQVSQSGERLLHLIEDLLNISRIEAGRMQFDFQPIDLMEIVEDEVKNLEPQALAKKLYLEFEKPTEPLPKVKADSLKIRQVIQNLIDNSIKYTEKGGSKVSVKQEGKQVVFSIIDTGIGLPKGQHLFEKFQRGQKATNQHTEGVGLGLYLADKLIKAHNGKIWAESGGENQGSAFYFTLPIT